MTICCVDGCGKLPVPGHALKFLRPVPGGVETSPALESCGEHMPRPNQVVVDEAYLRKLQETHAAAQQAVWNRHDCLALVHLARAMGMAP